MISTAHVLLYSAILTWVMVMVAAGLGGKLWTPKGLAYSLGNREDRSDNQGVAGRADRAAKNMLENMILFTAIVVAVHFIGAANKNIIIGANLFFWARVAYWPTYLLGIPGIRTGIWAVSVVGMGMMAASACCS